jgi:hypothetical protein
MDAIVFLIESQELRQGLEDCLRQRYEVITARGKRPLQETFDLAVLDEATLKRLHKAIQERRKIEPTRFLPFLLVTTSDARDVIVAHLGQTIDELLVWPADQVVLQTRVQNLLQARHLARDLEAARQQVQQLSLSEERHRACRIGLWLFYAHRLEPDGTIIREWVTPEAYHRVTGYNEHDLPTLDDPSARGRLIYPRPAHLAAAHPEYPLRPAGCERVSHRRQKWRGAMECGLSADQNLTPLSNGSRASLEPLKTSPNVSMPRRS